MVLSLQLVFVLNGLTLGLLRFRCQKFDLKDLIGLLYIWPFL